MTKVDILLLLPLAWGAIMGFKKGLIQELASIIGLLLGIWGAINFSQVTGKYLNQWFAFSESNSGLISFILTFILIVVLVILLGKVLDKFLKAIALGLLIRIAGMLFGILKYALILSFLLYFYEAIESKFQISKNQQWKKEAVLYQPITMLKAPFSQLLEDFSPENKIDLNLE